MIEVPRCCHKYPHSAITTDVVLFAIRNATLQLLLIRRGGEPFRGHWALPGGFLDIDEDLEDGALRELRRFPKNLIPSCLSFRPSSALRQQLHSSLCACCRALKTNEDPAQSGIRFPVNRLKEETGVSGVYLEQLRAYGRPGRDPRERVISVAYFALAPCERFQRRAASDAADAFWSPIGDLPPLAFDHDEIIRNNHERLLAKPDYSTIAFQLMPVLFALSELQGVYEILLDAQIDKRSFRKRTLALEQIEETGA
jgi:8-oxo-dGTP diphosphatase